jgi:hypothetical protein
MQKALKITIMAITTLLLLVFFSNSLMNRIFYNPYRDYENSSKVFNLSVQTLMPNYSHAYISVYEPGTPNSFSRFSQRIFISQLSAVRDINQNGKIQGSMDYSLGRVKYVENIVPSSKNVFSQEDFSQDREIKNIVIKEGSYYMAHIAFSKPLPTEEIIDSIQPKLGDGNGEIVRIIVKTSDEKNAVALGMDCQSSFFVFGQGGYTTNVTPNQKEIIFTNNLRFLKENDKTLQLYLASGLFGDIEVNIDERISYVIEHGFENIGVVLFVKGKTLQGLLQNPDFYLTFMEEDI